MAAATATGKKSFAEILSLPSHGHSFTLAPVLTDSNGSRQGLHRDMLTSSTHPISSVPAANSNVNGPKHGLHRGKPATFFPRPLLNSYAIPFKWALIGKFSQGRPRMEEINRFFVSLDLKGSFKLGLLDARHIIINCSVEEDFHRIFSRPNWNVYRWPMRVFKYTIDFHVNKESSIVPIWVNLERLPLVLFNKEALFTIASLIGQPLRLDTATAELKRPSVARVQIELDLLKPLPDTLWIGMGDDDGFWQEVKYENLPSYCTYCWHLGHSETHCVVKHPELKEVIKQKTQYVQTKKVYQSKPNQGAPVDEVKKGDDQNQTAEKEGWTTVQSRKTTKKRSSPVREHPHIQVAQLHLGDDESVMDFLVTQEKDFPSPRAIIDMPESSSIKEKPKDDHKNEANSDQNVEESNGQQSHQSQLYESDLSKAMVVYSQDQMEEFSTEVPEIPNIEKLREEEIQKLVQESIPKAANEVIENIADEVVKEHSSNLKKKSHAKRVSFQLPQDTEESSSQPLQSDFSSRPQVTDLTQEEFKNLVQEGIVMDEGSKDDPALEFHNDDENFEEELDEVAERENLSPRISGNKLFRTKGSRSRRKNNRYRDFYC